MPQSLAHWNGQIINMVPCTGRFLGGSIGGCENGIEEAQRAKGLAAAPALWSSAW